MNALPVLFENDEILLINKRAGLAVQGGEKVSHPVDEILERQLGFKVYPVHRLDKDTAGILVVAKNSAAAGKWTRMISSGSVRKQYSAVCFGVPGKGTMKDAPGRRGVFTADVGDGRNRRSARTEYRVVEVKSIPVDGAGKAVPEDSAAFDDAEPLTVSLLELVLGTGRTHQIRIHLAQAGCPIVADDKYGNFKLNKLLRRYTGVKTLQLVATRLEIPLDGEMRTFDIPLPPHMAWLHG